jgi:hypothetical protein
MGSAASSPVAQLDCRALSGHFARFLELHCDVDPKVHVSLTELCAGFYEFVHEPLIVLIDLETLHSMFKHPYEFLVVTGLRIKQFPNRAIEPI